MLKLIGKKTFTILCSKILFTKPMGNVSFEDKIKNHCSRTRMLSKSTFKAPITPEPKFVTSFLNFGEISFDISCESSASR